MLVAHINLPEVLRRYSQWERCTTAAERTPRPSKPAIETDWPPPAWVQGWRLAKQVEKLDAEWESYAERLSLTLDIPPPCRPIGDELLVVSADQFHRLLRERGVKVLVYDGFWADACLVNKEGAMHDMAGRGYLCIALRDATTTREHADTLDGLWATHAAIDHIEASVGYTTTTEAFVGASRAIGGRSPISFWLGT